MKYSINIILIFLLCIFGSCKKNIDGVFRAEVETQTQTKTHLSPIVADKAFNIIWDNDDIIKIYGDGDVSNFYITDYEDANHQIANFHGNSVTGPTFTSFYPSSIAVNENTCRFPSSQIYKSRSDGYVYEYPMFAQSVNNSNHLYFRNLCSLVILRLQGPNGAKIRNISLIEPSDPIGSPLSGEFNVSASGDTRTNDPIITPVNPEYNISMSFDTYITFGNDLELVYLYIPPGSHKRMSVYIEYQLSGSTEWKSTYRTLYPESYSKETFTFVRNQWSLLDVDITDLNSSSYYDTENIVFNPSQSGDTVINTHASITNAYDNYTFLVDVTPSDVSSTTYNDAIQKAIYSEMDMASPWNGVVIRIDSYNGTPYYQFTIKSQRCQGPLASNNVRQKFVCVLNASSNSMYIYYMNGNTLKYQVKTVSSSYWITTQDPTPMIGGDQHQAGRYFDGTIHYFKIYNSILTTSQIRTFLNS